MSELDHDSVHLSDSIEPSAAVFRAIFPRQLARHLPARALHFRKESAHPQERERPNFPTASSEKLLCHACLPASHELKRPKTK